MKKSAIVAAILVLGATCSTALGEGGQLISSAPAVKFGSQEFGNTLNGQHERNPCDNYRSYWLLPVTAGDAVTIDWEAVPLGTVAVLYVMPIGTTDYNRDSTQATQQQSPQSNGRNELKFVASRSGAMPLIFRAGSCYAMSVTGGPYNFTAYVHHRIVLSARFPGRVGPQGATVRVSTKTPDGKPISGPGVHLTLSGTWGRRPHVLSKAAPGGSGTASLRIKLPASLKGSRVRLSVTATGSQYQPARATSRGVLVK